MMSVTIVVIIIIASISAISSSVTSCISISISIPSLWRERHPAVKGLRPPEHHAGKFHPDLKRLLRVKNNKHTGKLKTDRMETPRRRSALACLAPRTLISVSSLLSLSSSLLSLSLSLVHYYYYHHYYYRYYHVHVSSMCMYAPSSEHRLLASVVLDKPPRRSSGACEQMKLMKHN